MTEQREDLELREAIDRVKDDATRQALILSQRRTAAYAQRNWDRITRYGHLTFMILAVLAAVQLGLGGWSLYLTAQNDRRIKEVHALVSANQAQRKQSVLSTCADQNRRHDRTIITLDRELLMAIHVKPQGSTVQALDRQLKAAVDGSRSPRAHRLSQSHNLTVLLINALAPRFDCKQRAKRLAGPIKPAG